MFDEYAFLKELLVNDAEDLAALRSVGRVLAKCLDMLQACLGQCRIAGDRLVYDGIPVDSRWLARLAEVFLAERDVTCEYAIVGSGPQSFHPHQQRTHPLRAREPIIVDIACRSVTTGFFADASRTWCRGEPLDTRFVILYDLISRVKTAVEARMAPSVSVARLHDYTMKMLSQGGVRDAMASAALASDAALSADEGPVIHHSLGHGIGRDLHQPPIIGERANVPLMAGMAIAFEPGCYLYGLGGVRLEDTLEVTELGIAPLTLTSSNQFVLD